MLIIITILLLLIYLYLGWKHSTIALVTCPFVAGTMIFIGVADENIMVAVIAAAIFIATLVAVLMSEREPDSEQWPYELAKFIAILIGFFSPLFLAGYFLYLAIEDKVLWLHVYSIGLTVFVVLIVGVIVAFELASSRAIAAYIFSTIGSSMRQNLPLPMALESAAIGLKDDRARILHKIKGWLVQGYSLSESIKRGYPRCPGYILAMITADERIGQLPSAMQAIEDDMVAKANERRKIRPVHPLYPVILIICMIYILWELMMFVVPQFTNMINEMTVRAALPSATRILIRIFDFVSYDVGWLIGIILAIVVLMTISFSIDVKFRPRRPDKPYLLSRIGDYIKWHLPVLHSFEKNYSLVHVVELLRLSLNAGCPVNEAIENTLGLDINNCFKRRLQRWLERVERGENIAVAIKESGLGSPLAWAFDEKVNQGNTLTILETLESFYRSNYSYAVNLARFIMWPCLILCMGVIIGFVVYGIFSPGVVIIKSLAESVIP
jgi:type II secretory pathway component PulF